MRNCFPWDKLIDDFHGFEELAVEFLKSKYKGINWMQTQPTRDGNTDAVAIVMGYQAKEKSPVQWWMEAKYSNTNKRLSRYRIDSTVVSAIIDGNVHKVAFVTNIEIDTKTMADIAEALKHSTNCTDVEFYTKYSLEYWLLTNLKFYDKFFGNYKHSLPILVDEYIISQDITYYNVLTEHLSFKEPQQELVIGNEYIAYFSIFSPKEMVLSICIASNLKGIKFLSKVKNIPIKQGENTLNFHFLLKENYGYKKSKRSDIPMPAFRIGQKNIPSYKYVPVSHKNTIKLNLESQKSLLMQLQRYYCQYLKEHCPFIVSICGNSDVGKSMILENFIVGCSLKNGRFFYYEFTESIKENARILLYLLMYILIPYIAPETIDESYAEHIENTEVKSFILNFINYKDNDENILLYISKLLGNISLFPNKILINTRTIILDNIHLLDNKSAFLVSKIISEVYEKNLPVFIIICGQQFFYDSKPYEYLRTQCVIHHIDLEINIKDILKACKIPDEGKYDLSVLDTFKMDAVGLLLFYRYMMAESRRINTLEELIIALRLFWSSSIIEQHILDKFKTMRAQNEKYQYILDKIYWSCSPININEFSDLNSELKELMAQDLIKYNIDGNIISKYALYQFYYKEHFLPTIENLNYITGTPEDIRIKLLTSPDRKILLNCMENISNLFDSKAYFTIDFILKNVFCSKREVALKNILNSIDYYKLYYYYAYAAHQNGVTDACQTIFTKIYDETNSSYDIELLHISLKCIWELGVIAYEKMLYNEVFHWKNCAVKTIDKIQDICHEKKEASNYINYHDFMVLDTLINKEQDLNDDDNIYETRLHHMEICNFQYRALSFSARYALVLCTHNIEHSIELLQITGQKILELYGEDDKHYLWCQFYYNFYMMVWQKDNSYLPNVINYHEKMREDQYGNYRKKLYAIAAYLYSINDLANGNKYLFQDSIFPYEARERYQAFYHETMALYEAINDNIQDAIDHLDKAIILFNNLERYISIPLHNKQLLVENKFSTSNISFLFGPNMDAFTYYIDLYSAW